MDVRGERECKSCGTRWSYFETGSVECPSCGSIRSVGVGDRALHTDAGGDLDLTEARQVGADNVLDGLEPAKEACREYCQSRGFVAGGELLDLDDTYLAAQELRRVAVFLTGKLRVGDEEERHVLALLNGADEGERPAPEDVPKSMWAARGLACAASVDAYRAAIREHADGSVPDPESRLLERVREHGKRLEALDGEVEPADSERLVAAVRAVADSLRGDDSGVERARTRLDALER